jgi:hypothetical protein
MIGAGSNAAAKLDRSPIGPNLLCNSGMREIPHERG